jgi:hypothetical protein
VRDPAPQSAFEEVTGVRTIGCRHQGDYVQFVLREWPGGGTVSVSGSYDAMSTHGFSFGKGTTLAQFLADCDMSYMMKKLLSGKTTEPDWEASVKALKRELLNNRRADGREADEAKKMRDESPLSLSSMTAFGYRYTNNRPGLTKGEARERWDEYFGDPFEGDEEIFRRAVTEAPDYVFGGDAYELGQNKLRGWIPYFWNQFWLPFMDYLKANPKPAESTPPKASSDV